ncbi:MAG: hypothetical protein KME10_11410 [Plectolyngbya sp. WJT66-NPBG17]|jgi:hypothetical protein|nr:hypothetical protein [Plectolyngbya sp. WJT66-NPBG17]
MGTAKREAMEEQEEEMEALESRLEELDFDSEEDAQEIDEILSEMRTNREDYLRTKSIQEMSPSDAQAALDAWQYEADQQDMIQE